MYWGGLPDLMMIFKLPPKGSGCFIPPDGKYRGQKTEELREWLKENPLELYINDPDLLDILPPGFIERGIEREAAFRYWSTPITSGMKEVIYLYIHDEDKTPEFRSLLWAHFGAREVNKTLEKWFYEVVKSYLFVWEKQVKVTKTKLFKSKVTSYRKMLENDRLPDGWSKNDSLHFPQYNSNGAMVYLKSSDWELGGSLFILPFAIIINLIPLRRYEELFEAIYSKLYGFFHLTYVKTRRQFEDDPWKGFTDMSQLITDCKDPAEAMAWIDTVRELNMPEGYRE